MATWSSRAVAKPLRPPPRWNKSLCPLGHFDLGPNFGWALVFLFTLENGLKADSYMGYTKLATLDRKLSLGKIGTLETALYKKLKKEISAFLEVI